MTTRRLGLATLCSVVLLAFAVAFSLKANADTGNPLLVAEVEQSYEVAIEPLGPPVGNHTYYHEALPLETDEHIVQTLAATNNAIARAAGRTTSCMRPPYGSLDERSIQIVHNQGYNVSMWEVDSNDWKLTSAYDIAAGVLRDTNLGHRVLFHDGPANRAATVAALESVLAVLSQRGVIFAALPC